MEEVKPVKYLGVVTRRPEPVVISTQELERLQQIEIKYNTLLKEVEELRDYKFRYESCEK